MTITINIALAISLIIGTALQAIMFISTLTLRRYANKALDEAKNTSDEANNIAQEAERINSGAMLCMRMANELCFCHSKDERANLLIKWLPQLQEAGVSIEDINDFINN